MTKEEATALAAIRATYVSLDGWRVRCRSVERPEAGSELAGDEGVWPYMDPAEVARQGLASTTQHLNLARVAVEAGEVFPTAHYSVLRGGLVGACMAVWVLGPDVASDRQQRALRIVDEVYRRALQHHDYVRPLVDEHYPEVPPWIDSGEHMRRRMKEARWRWTSAQDLTEKEALNVTSVIDVVSRDVFDPSEALEVRLLWRQMSGDAHALTWQLIGRSQSYRDAGAGMAEFAAGGDLVQLADAFDKVFRLASRGWSLFDRRCEGGPSSAN